MKNKQAEFRWLKSYRQAWRKKQLAARQKIDRRNQ
jgi:hypothetical protein